MFGWRDGAATRWTEVAARSPCAHGPVLHARPGRLTGHRCHRATGNLPTVVPGPLGPPDGSFALRKGWRMFL